MTQSNPDKYTCPARFVKGYIHEFDLVKANISILLHKGLISQKQYEHLYNAPRMERQVAVGMMQKHDEALSKALLAGFGEAREMLYTANGIEMSDIVSVKKDAVFILNKIPKTTDFGCLHFTCRNTYTAFYKLLDNNEAYYTLMGNREKMDIKGIGDDTLKLHEGYMLDLLATIFSASMVSTNEAISVIQDISKLYLNWELDPRHFREFNNRSLYRTFYRLHGERAYITELPQRLTESDKKYIDPSYNYCLLQYLYATFVGTLM